MSSGKKLFRVEPSNPQIDPVDLTAAEVRNLIGICIKFINPCGRVTRKFAAAAPAREEVGEGPATLPSARSRAFLRVTRWSAEAVLALGYEPRPRAASSSAPAASRYDAGARNLPQLSVGRPPSGKGLDHRRKPVYTGFGQFVALRLPAFRYMAAHQGGNLSVLRGSRVRLTRKI